jgi:TPR repeat protein
LVDQGNAEYQLRYGRLLHARDGIPMNKSMAVDYFTSNTDHGNKHASIQKKHR